MNLSEESRRRILDQVFERESGSSAHLSESAFNQRTERAIQLMEDYPPAEAYELAFEEDKHPRKSDGKFAPKGQGEQGKAPETGQETPANGKSENVKERAGADYDTGGDDPGYSVKPGGFLKRDKTGAPISQEVGAPAAYEPHGRMAPEHAERSKQRYDSAAQLADIFKVDTGPEKPGEDLQRITDADTPELMRTRDRIKQFESGWREKHGVEDTSGLDSPERRELRNAIIDDLYGQGAAKKERQAFLITGPPGAGKSTLVRQRGYTDPEKFGALEIDSDMAKEQLPEFNGGRGANLVHEESSEISKRLLTHAMNQGDNIVHPTLGETSASLEKKIKMFQDQGYQVHVDNVFIEPERSAESVVARFHKNGRFVPPEMAMRVSDNPLKVHKEMEAKHAGGNIHFTGTTSDALFSKNSVKASEEWAAYHLERR